LVLGIIGDEINDGSRLGVVDFDARWRFEGVGVGPK
jgi:hypothetical protein